MNKGETYPQVTYHDKEFKEHPCAFSEVRDTSLVYLHQGKRLYIFRDPFLRDQPQLEKSILEAAIGSTDKKLRWGFTDHGFLYALEV